MQSIPSSAAVPSPPPADKSAGVRRVPYRARLFSPESLRTANVAAWSAPVLLLGLYLASVSSISSQMFIVYLGLPIPVIGLAFGGALLGWLISGRQLAFLSTPFAFPWIALMAWWGVASVFGIYPTGSLDAMIPYSYRIHILPFIFAAAAANVRHVRTLMYMFTAGYALILVYCFRYGQMIEDRFGIAETTLSNGNDLALHLVLGSTFMALWLRRLAITRFLWILTTPVLMYYVLKTGSRSNMLALAVLAVLAIWVSPRRTRPGLALAVMVFAVMTVPFVPSSVWNRLTTFTSVDAESVSSATEAEYANRAVGSTTARLELQKKALLMTAMNPLFGVGPKMFPDAVERMVRDNTGRKSTWQVTHNAYLQVSSESGIPGFIFYTWCVLLCLKLNYRVYKQSLVNPALADVTLQSLCLFMGSAAFAFGVLFCSIAYDYHLAALVGFTSANCLAVRDILDARRAADPTAKARVRAF